MTNRKDAIQLTNVLREFIIAALWSSNDESTPEGGEPFDANYSMTDIAIKSFKLMRDDVDGFLKKNRELIKQSRLSDEQVGHDLWLTSHHHGTGFWDRGLPKEIGDKLTKAAQEIKERQLVLGDDKKIYYE